MSADPKNSSIDLEKLRHDLAGAIGTLQTAMTEIRGHTKGVEDAVELYDIGIQRLNSILAMIDSDNTEH